MFLSPCRRVCFYTSDERLKETKRDDPVRGNFVIFNKRWRDGRMEGRHFSIHLSLLADEHVLD